MNIRNFLFTFLCVLLYGHTSGQNWQPVVPDKIYYYSTSDSGIVKNSISVDSVRLLGADSIYFLNRAIDPYDTIDKGWGTQSFFYFHQLFGQTQFLQSELHCYGDSLFWFTGPGSLLLKPLAKPGDSWLFDSISSISITLEEVQERYFIGLIDSVKKFSLSNGDSLLLSKNYGIVYFPRLDGLPTSFYLWGISGSEKKGKQLPAMYEFFDLAVGDFFDYWGMESQPERPQKYMSRRVTVLKREQTANELKLNVQVTGYDKQYKPDILIKYTKNISIPFHGERNLASPPHTAVLKSLSIDSAILYPTIFMEDHWFWMAQPVYPDANESMLVVGDGLWWAPRPAYFKSNEASELRLLLYEPGYIWINDSTWLPGISVAGCCELVAIVVTYAKGLGMTCWSESRFEYDFILGLKGYRKNGQVSGTLLLEIDEKMSINEPRISPNPAGTKAELLLPGDPGHWIVSIFSLQGTPVARMEDRLTDRFQLQVSEVPAGTYVCRCVAPGKAMYSLKMQVVH